MDNKMLRLKARIELAKIDFFYYCNLKAPEFYKEDRKFLVDLCQDMQDFYEGNDEVLVVNLPPRHGKSRTAQLFVEWVLGHDNTQKIMTGSYNETLSTVFSKGVRNSIQEIKGDKYKPTFNDVFPTTKIKRGDASMNLWSLEGGYNNYLATSPSGTATGFGATIMVVDDLIKNAEEANNDNVLQKQWEWFTNTMLSRLEKNGKIIIIMTRWHSEDLAGRVLNWCKTKNKRYKHINLPAILNTKEQEMLCSDILDYNSAMDKKSVMGPDIFSANYLQVPIDLEGCLYGKFKTYKQVPEFEAIRAYCDTADEGQDYLCCIVYGVYRREAYLLDVLYTQEAMETTEGKTARMLYENNVNKCRIESNNGGKGFARRVRDILTEKYNSNYTVVKWFHQSKNKQARILTNATWIQEHVLVPVNWADLWPEFFEAITKYQRGGKNRHDDGPDSLTGVAEDVSKKSGARFE